MSATLCSSPFNGISIIQHQMAKGGEKSFRVYGPRIWYTSVSYISITSAGCRKCRVQHFHIPVYVIDAGPLQLNDIVIASIMLQDPMCLKHEITSAFYSFKLNALLKHFLKDSSEQSILNLALRIWFHMITPWYLIPVWHKSESFGGTCKLHDVLVLCSWTW